ncbi:MAG: hypothetical protein A2898_04940 [Candidatus Kerfeldbacteria bacterium RIFCSPLOWO2_01_FULL_48_11]|uniref:Dihydrofolate reductase n=1 Tax=Candidatus Kerfeldbacteria bacterium RIFCSPLOWO2_01_FULL_48_11 TaxID=1798543 RepID=A0A1G2B163_9BACT|nr:MAG: Dihydrofolate reductase [Parcubacteria group bacterium GW2011_GWA2_48_9]KKW15667.1 MAG: Dihydrofolate reductase [Parcubacteria group bacterium GW2011_GWC2_49_9]OGY82898.1 MAG: hypothetical protein A2898_04940 [Candidatus Kerfeldbacteria bacterium RIFCSPLOWO2_01_FULL_48_11]HCJ52794.1 hypothetical protein [Candidatus Kerfeldbacteria bacterium]
MPQPTVSMIAAIDEERGLGKDNQLLFKIKEDLQHFKNVTSGHPVIMGRKTYESIGKPLPNRTNIVISRNQEYRPEGCVMATSLDQAIDEAKKIDKNEIFIIGGGQIFKQGMLVADKLYLTVVKGNYGADVFFPDYSVFSRVVTQRDCQSEEFIYTMYEFEKEA